MKCLLFVLKIDAPSPTQAGFVGAPETDFTHKECREYRFRTTLLKLGECSCRDVKHKISTSQNFVGLPLAPKKKNLSY